MLYAVSVRQPFASLILSGIKRYEARSWHPVDLGWLLLHASSGYAITKADMEDSPLYEEAIAKGGLSLDRDTWTRSAILGAFCVSRIHHRPPKQYTAMDAALAAEKPDVLWQIGETITFPDPIPCHGKLGLFVPPPSVMKTVRRHLQF